MIQAVSGWKQHTAIVAGIVAITALLFARAVTFDFVNYDDNLYVTGNPIVQRGLDSGTFAWAWTAFVGIQWYPLTVLSHLVDVSLYGLDPAGHHATSVALHALTAGTLYLALVRLTGLTGRSACVALLFALHPLRAESVVWVAERKDVLSGLFWMLTLLAYAGYTRSPGAGRYALVLIAFACGLMSKPMVVTLPCVLLLLDWWPLRRIPDNEGAWGRRSIALIAEKLPLFALAGVAAGMTLYSQSIGGAVSSIESHSILQRVLTALGGYWMYARQLVFPAGLSVFYPMPDERTLYARAALGLALIFTLSLLVWRLRVRQPAALVGWLWFLGVLVPVIGFVQVGAQAHADRYTYLPHVGLLIAAVWLAAGRLERLPAKVPMGLAAVVCAVLMAMTWRQTGYWRSSEALFARAIAATNTNARAHDYYGLALLDQGRYAEAIPQFEEAIRLEGASPQQRYNLATAFEKSGDRQKATALMRETVKEFPEDHATLLWLGMDALNAGRPQEAAELLVRAAQARPDRPEIRVNLGIALGQLGRRAEAEAEFDAALRANPWYAPAYANLGVLLVDAGDVAGAREMFTRALALDPSNEATRAAIASLDAPPG